MKKKESEKLEIISGGLNYLSRGFLRKKNSFS